jgi:hypothetical protein
MFLLKENGLWNHANTAVTVPIDLVELAKHEAWEAKTMRMILDLMRDHLVPHLLKKIDVPNQVSITPYHSHSLMPNP